MKDLWWVGEDDLDDDQKRAVALPSQGVHLVVGPPGSGKTNILLLRAKYLALAGCPNTRIVVFNRSLQRFITAGGQEYGFAEENVTTSARLFRDVLFELGAEPHLEGTFEEQRRQLCEQVAHVAEETGTANLFDAILLDECQDYTEEEAHLFMRLSDSVFAVGDSRQSIYRREMGKSALDLLAEFASERVELRYHYRNGREICALADGMSKHQLADNAKMVATCNYRPGGGQPTVEIVRGSLSSQCSKMMELLKVQLRAYPDELLGVICPKRSDLDAVAAKLDEDWSLAARYSHVDEEFGAFDPDRPICLCTGHGAKGLEFRAVHLLAADTLMKFKLQRNLGYTAATRAKTSLTIYHEGVLPGWLQSAIARSRGRVAAPPLGAPFGKGGSK